MAALFFAFAPDSVTNRMMSMFDLRDPSNRDRLAMDYRLQMVVGQNATALEAKTTFPDTQHLPEGDPHRISRVDCCRRDRGETS